MGFGGGGMIADWIKSAADDTKRDQLTLYNMYDANRRENTRHSEWQEGMNAYNERFSRAAADMRRAGMNPMLALGAGGGAGPGGGSPVAAGAGAPAGERGSSISFSASAAAAAQASLVGAEARLKQSQADNLDADTASKREQPALTRAQVSESIQRAKTLMAQESREYASAAQAGQAVVNMQAELPRIKADVDRLKASTWETFTRAGLNEAQAREVMQKVNQNLPELERALAEFQVKLDALKVPGAQSAAMAQDSFVGVLGAYIKALLPLDSFMGSIPLGKSAPTINRGPTIINRR